MPFGTYSATPSANTSIAGNNIGPGGPPGAIDNAIRQIMADARLFSDGIPATQALATQAILASATVGVYPTAASSNIPRGLLQAGVGAITPGTTGTNGTFDVTWTGGNFLINPSATFTVAGGVLTAFNVTGPGMYIGATATVPTPLFTASAGLTGASVVLTAQFLVTAGVGYWVARAGGNWLDRYANNSGTATATPAVDSIFVGDLSGVAAVAANIASVNTAAANIASIIAAPDAATTATTQAGIATAAVASIGGAKALSVAIGLTSDVVQIGADIVATQKHSLGATDPYDFVASTGRDLFPAGARVFGSWSAAHRGMTVPVSGAPGEVYEVQLPSGSIIGANNSIIYIGIVTPTTPLPLAQTPVTFNNPRVCGMIDLRDRGAQTLGTVTWRGAPVSYAAGDLLVYWGLNVQFAFGTNLTETPPASTNYDGQYHIVYNIPGANDGTALGTGFTETPFAATGSSARQFPYIAKTGAGTSRALIGLPNSPAFLDAAGKLPLSVMPVSGNTGTWAGQAIGIMGTSIETPTGGTSGATGWVPGTIAALGAVGTPGGVGSSLFCYIGDQGGGGDKLSFSATPAELTAMGGNPANGYQAKCFDKGFKLLVIGGGVINDVSRNLDNGSLCAIGTSTDTSPNTIWGAFNRVIPQIQANSPGCQIVIEGVQHGILGRGGVTEAAIRTTYNEALRAIAKRYYLPFLDFLNMSGITLSNYTTRLGNDGGAYIHPLQVQQDQMARQATAFLNAL